MSSSDLATVFNAPDLFVRTARRNQSFPWDENYRPYPYQQSAYDFWEDDLRRQTGNVHPYNNNRHKPGTMESDDYHDMNAWMGGKPNAYFYSQEGLPEDEEMDHTFIHLGDNPLKTDTKNAAPTTGGEGWRGTASIYPKQAYCSAEQLGAIASPYEREVSSPDTIRTGGYNCSSGLFGRSYKPQAQPSDYKANCQERSKPKMDIEIYLCTFVLLIAGAGMFCLLRR